MEAYQFMTVIVLFIGAGLAIGKYVYSLDKRISNIKLKRINNSLLKRLEDLEVKLASLQIRLEALEILDEYKLNKELK